MSWLEVSLTVNGELAEAVADVLARFAPNGVTTEQGVGYANDEDEGTPAGPITVRAYLPADEKLEETRQKLEQSLFYLGMIQPLPVARFSLVADQNWMEAWKEHYHPIPIGKRLIIVPVWLESPEAERVAIKIDPGMAFGTGTHPTTQLCLELVEKFFDNGYWKEDDSRRTRDHGNAMVNAQRSMVIDVGCGSGILSIGALKLGAEYALGVDIDEASVKASRENADANDIQVRRFEIGKGSVTEIMEGNFAIRQAQLVLANILAPIIIRLFDVGLAELVERGGVLVLSGILAEQADSVGKAAHAHGLRFLENRQSGDWVALAFER
jgi:ribosomal protein L11 methyltransferase